MIPAIKTLPNKKLIGKRLTMSLINDKTPELWRIFMPRRKEIKNSLTSDLFCLQMYNQSFDGNQFNPDMLFGKWAAVEVLNFDMIPEDMETYTLTGGLYAVFIHKGAANTGAETFNYIFSTWLPASEYVLDNRPHFEIWEKNIKTTIRTRKKKFGFPLNSNYRLYYLQFKIF
ncbi:GyrI-like domain-containing protein [Dyadobacter sp. NIV53]|uniref:GyrI-like domain-containing protein n=1 Tax=Dyadobacter sp. NIV53 TaxID=2861765 RepID=UPI00286E83C9|nr:GyrI-like domain-containing protein [Dyadobacter sp. NIV53]